MEARVQAYIIQQVIRQIARGYKDCYVLFDKHGATSGKY